MSNDTFLWHAEQAPDGRVFDLEKHLIKTLEDEGWVDAPAKIGLDVHCGNDGDFKKAKQAFDAGDVRGIGGEVILVSVTSKDMELKEKELYAVRERLSEKDREIASLKKRIEELTVKQSVPASTPTPRSRAKAKDEPKPAVPKDEKPAEEEANPPKPDVPNDGDETDL